MATQEERREYISSCLRTADDWGKKGNTAWEERCLSSALMNYISLAVMECRDGQEAREWLIAEGFRTVAARQESALKELVAAIDAKKLPSSALGGSYTHLVLTHIRWALGDFAAGEEVAEIANHPNVLELSTPFWTEYARAIDALINSCPYTVSDLSLKGYERYWVQYLRLLELATKGQDTDAAVVSIDKAFRTRNSDKSNKDDAFEIEGSSIHPVFWDFRRDGLLNYIRSK